MSSNSDSSVSSNSPQPIPVSPNPSLSLDISRPSIATQSTSGLILLPDDEYNNENSPVGFAENDYDDLDSPLNAAPPSENTIPLSSNVAFLYFLSPILKLGAILYFSGQLPLKFTIPALVVSAIISAFARHIWFLLARYVRKTELEDVIQYAFIRGRRHEGMKIAIRAFTKYTIALLHVSLASLYLKESVDLITLYIFETNQLQWIALTSLLITTSMVPFCLTASTGSRSIVYTSVMSVVTYIFWIISLVYAARQVGPALPRSLPSPGLLWSELPIILLTFSSPNNLLIYGSMIGTVSSVATKDKRFSSISLISVMSCVVGFCLILPIPFLRPGGTDEPQEQMLPSPSTAAATLSAATLILGIPFMIVTSPILPVPRALRRFFKIPTSRIFSLCMMFALSLLPGTLFGFLGNVTLTLALMGSYFVPALIHIIYHYLRQPLSILVQPRPTNSSELQSPTHDTTTDELLRRKERALQRKRLGRRIFWDMGVWLLLIPLGGGSIVWAIGRLTGTW